MVKNPPGNAGNRCKGWGFDPWVGKIPWRRKWPPTPGFLPGESHGQRSLGGYSPWGCKESDTTEHTLKCQRLSALTLLQREWVCSGPSVSEAVKLAQSCPTLCDPMDCSLPRSSTHGILQARILEWVAISFSRRSSQPRDRSRVSRTVGRRFTI